MLEDLTGGTKAIRDSHGKKSNFLHFYYGIYFHPHIVYGTYTYSIQYDCDSLSSVHPPVSLNVLISSYHDLPAKAGNIYSEKRTCMCVCVYSLCTERTHLSSVICFMNKQCNVSVNKQSPALGRFVLSLLMAHCDLQ